MRWLAERARQGREILTYSELAAFSFEGSRVALLDRERGIRKPATMHAALSIRTTYTPPGQAPPYEDAEGADGLIRYKYRGSDPLHPENVALRRALEDAVPLIWFVGVAPGAYLPLYPIWIVGDEPAQLQFALAVEMSQTLVGVGAVVDDAYRRYITTVTRQRLHQPLFRARVLTAYGHHCAMCRLHYPPLLDAAHILPDQHPRGTPVVPNGLALCKIHHAAYDENYLGIRPDLIVEVRSDVRKEKDGPMLLHGLQEMAGVRIIVPRSRGAWPDSARLEERYEEFRRAS